MMSGSSSNGAVSNFRKRTRDPLTSHLHESRSTGVPKNYYLESRGLEITSDKCISTHLRGKHAVEVREELKENFKGNCENMKELNGTEYEGAYKDRRQAIKYLYLAVFAAPPQMRWHTMKLIPAISYMLKIPKNSHSNVKKTLLQISQEKDHYSSTNAAGAGRPPLIDEGTAQAEVICRALECGLSVKDATCILNIYRSNLDPPLEIVSRSAV